MDGIEDRKGLGQKTGYRAKRRVSQTNLTRMTLGTTESLPLEYQYGREQKTVALNL